MIKNLLIFLVAVMSLSSCSQTEKKDLFQKDNMIPWSIVGFDIKERTPQQRIKMLKDLGFYQYGYGHRTRHIPYMEEEFRYAQENGVRINNVWLYINLKKDKPGALRTQNEVVFENLKKTGLETQIWVGIDSRFYEGLSNEKAMESTLEMISYLAEKAADINCKIALYNHGGWYGVPDNQLAIITALPEYKIGVVFNFHHAHDEFDHYAENIKKLYPYLWCVNLNGMRKEGPKIITVGQGDSEKRMIDELLTLGYKGPWGILGHVKGGDPEVVLEANYKGLQSLYD